MTKNKMAALPEGSPNLIMELTHAVERTEMLYNAAKLRLFDVLERHGGPMTSREMARDLGLTEQTASRLERLLNVCANLGLLRKTFSSDTTEALYRNTPESSAYLTSGSDHSLLGLVDAARHQFNLAEMIRADEVDESRSWFFDQSENARVCARSQQSFRRYYLKQDGYSRTSVQLLKAFDLTKYRSVVDLGGGLGTCSRFYKQFYPEASVTCYDMPDVVDMAREQDDDHGRTGCIQYSKGDLFSSAALPEADLYIVGHLIHMFDDERAKFILSKARKALRTGGAVLLLEKVMTPERDGPELCLMYDVRMNMSASHGSERTAEEYRSLLTQAGYSAETMSVHVNEGYNIYDAILCEK